MQHISESLATQAWEQYELASARAARYITGQQLDLVDVIEDTAVRAFWLETYLACERESLRPYPREGHGCVYPNGDGACQECADLASLRVSA